MFEEKAPIMLNRTSGKIAIDAMVTTAGDGAMVLNTINGLIRLRILDSGAWSLRSLAGMTEGITNCVIPGLPRYP